LLDALVDFALVLAEACGDLLADVFFAAFLVAGVFFRFFAFVGMLSL
jgi:hypothetical protein